MNTQLQINNINKTPSQSKTVSFAAMWSNANLLLEKYGKKASKDFWKYTKSTGNADITSYKGLL